MSQSIEGKVNPYELEVGHMKEGGTHVLKIKSLKIRADSFAEPFEQLDSALSVFEVLLEKHGSSI